jgi:hypothetical protein
MNDWIRWETVDGEPLQVGETTVTPQSRVLVVKWPFDHPWFNGGFVWNRPVAVTVNQGQETTRLPIVDVTRLTMFILLGVGLGITLVLGQLARLWQRLKRG